MRRSAAIGAGICAVLMAARGGDAAPHAPRAKADFDRGVQAYQKADYPAASEWFKRSFAVEPDAETLFAWAQAERQQDHCAAAIELYRKLDAFPLPGPNRDAVIAKRQECQAILDARRPADASPPGPGPTPVVEPVAVLPPSAGPERRARPWYADAAGDTLVLGGLVGLGVGAHLWVAAYDDSTRPSNFTTHAVFQATARHEGTIGTVCITGGVLAVAGGVLRYRLSGGERGGETSVTAWGGGGGGGVTVFGRF